MNNKNLTPQESLSIITDMIETTRPQPRIAKLNLKISLMWALLTIVTAAATLILLMLTRNPQFNYLWFAIPLIGLPVNALMARKSQSMQKAVSRIDQIRSNLWKTVSLLAILLTALCLAFHLCGYQQAWLAMLYYAFIIVGFGATMEGVLLKERAYTFGGIFSIISGFGIICAKLCHLPVLITWVVPLYILSFLLMFVVPALIVFRKLKATAK